MLAHRSAVLLLLMLSAFPLAAQSPPLFEAVVVGGRSQCSPFQAPSARGVEWINPDRVDLTTDTTTYISHIGSADNRRVLGIQRLPGPSFRVVELRPDGSVLPVSPPIAGFSANGIDVGTDGRIFVTASPVAGSSTVLLVLSPAGTIEFTWPIDSGAFEPTVGNDNCTVYFLYGNAGRRLGRFNACTGTRLADVPTILDDYLGIFVLPDGRLVLSSETTVYLYSADGTLIRTLVSDLTGTYSVGSQSTATDIAVSADMQSLYIAVSVNCNFSSNGRLLRVSFENGTQISNEDLAFQAIPDLIVGGPGGAGPAPGAGAANVPTLSEWMLALLAMTLAAVGWRFARI